MVWLTPSISGDSRDTDHMHLGLVFFIEHQEDVVLLFSQVSSMTPYLGNGAVKLLQLPHIVVADISPTPQHQHRDHPRLKIFW